jgi:hypothetical protein
MSKNEVSEVTDKAIAKGGILTKLYFDMQSDKAEELQPLMADLIDQRLLKAPGVIYAAGSIDEPIKLEDVYSTNAVVTVLFNDLGSLINIVFNFSPVGIEVLKPEGDYVIKSGHLNSILISLSQISMDYSKYILTKVLKGEELEKVNRELRIREEMGKRAIKGSAGETPKEKAPDDQ